MEKRTRVLVYGNTLNMAGIAASLRAEPELVIESIDPKTPCAQQDLKSFDPEAVIFDCSDSCTVLDLALLREQPGLLLIGVDPSSDDALVLSGQLSRVLSARDLAKLVTDFGKASNGKRTGDRKSRF